MDDRDRQLDENLAAAARRNAAGTPAAPDQRLVTDRARRRAATLRVDGRGRLRLRLAEVAVVLVIVAALIVILVPIIRQAQLNRGESRLPQMATAAWASTEGHVIEFTIRYDSWDDIPDYNAPFHPRRETRAAVNSWLEQHPGLKSETPGLPVADVSMSYFCREEPEAKLELQVLVSVGDSELVRDLAQAICETTGFTGPETSSRTLYFSGEYPELLSDEVTIRIDGQDYCFPHDFTIDEARSIARDLRNWRTSYEGRFGFGISRRFGDFVVFKLEHLPGGVLDYAVITRELEVDEEVRDTISGHSNTVFEPDQEDLAHPWRDPVLELIRLGRFHNWSSRASRGRAETRIDVAIYYCSSRLVSEDKWGLLQERRQRLIDEGREQLPPLTDEDWVEIEEWAIGLEEQLPADVLERTGKTWMELGRDEYNNRRATKIDRETRQSAAYRSFPELTEEERAQALLLAERLRNVTKHWYADNAEAVYESGPGTEISRRVKEVDGVPVSFLITLRCNDPEYADSLRATLEGVEGLVQPWQVSESSIGHSVGTDDQAPPIIGG